MNFFTGLESFVHNWDNLNNYEDRENGDLPFVKGTNGAINLNGDLDCIEASIFSKNSKKFELSIEDGVKKLTLFFAQNLDFITYTSCEGHSSDKDSNLVTKYRHLGLLPRDANELAFLKEKLYSATENLDAYLPTSAIEVIIDETTLYSENLNMPCLDIIFKPKHDYELLYFEEIDEVYEAFFNVLQNLWNIEE